MTTDYGRGYSKGYSTGTRRSDEALAKAREDEQEALDRAARAEASQGFGKCRECARWRRERDAAWGYCSPPDSKYSRTQGAIWFSGNTGGSNRGAVTTSEAFGCVLFLKKSTE